MKVAIGWDEAAYEPKEILKSFVIAEGHEVADFGAFAGKPVLYPDIAHAVATSVAKSCNRKSGVLLRGTGIGMAMSGNWRRSSCTPSSESGRRDRFLRGRRASRSRGGRADQDDLRRGRPGLESLAGPRQRLVRPLRQAVDDATWRTSTSTATRPGRLRGRQPERRPDVRLLPQRVRSNALSLRPAASRGDLAPFTPPPMTAISKSSFMPRPASWRRAGDRRLRRSRGLPRPPSGFVRVTTGRLRVARHPHHEAAFKPRERATRPMR